MSLKIDSWLFTKILGDNPSMVIAALTYWAYAQECGKLTDAESEHPDIMLHRHPYHVLDALAEVGGRECTIGGQHIPSFLRQLALRIEAGQRAEVRKMVEKHGEGILRGLGQRLVDLAKEADSEWDPSHRDGTYTIEWPDE
jgi:hypothetical protein